MMQQYANILDRDIAVGNFPEGPALGAGIFAAVAAGIYPDALAGFEAMGGRNLPIIPRTRPIGWSTLPSGSGTTPPGSWKSGGRKK